MKTALDSSEKLLKTTAGHSKCELIGHSKEFMISLENHHSGHELGEIY